mgnify:CR=1 FL=1
MTLHLEAGAIISIETEFDDTTGCDFADAPCEVILTFEMPDKRKASARLETHEAHALAEMIKDAAR